MSDTISQDAAHQPAAADRPRPTVRLLAIDLDGTLLRSDKQVTRVTADAIAAATKAGVRVVLATARPPRATLPYYSGLGLDTLMINYNGALIHDPAKRRHLFHLPMDADLAGEIIDTARRAYKGCVVSVEILDRWYTDHYDETLPIETGRVFTPDFVGPLEAFLTRPVTKLMLLAQPEHLRKVIEAVQRKHGDSVNLSQSEMHMLLVMNRGASKGKALARVAEHYGVEQPATMAIGDAPNDVSMLRWAQLGVAMGNGWQAALDAANVVVASNDDNGVAQAIQRYVLG